MLATLFTWESCNPLFVICDRGVPACPLSLCVKPFFRDQTSSPGIYNVSTTPHRKASGLEMSCWKQPIMLRTLCIALSRLAGKHMKAACSYATFKVHWRACLHTHLDRFLVTKSINEAKGEMQLVSCRVVIFSTLAADFIVYESLQRLTEETWLPWLFSANTRTWLCPEVSDWQRLFPGDCLSHLITAAGMYLSNIAQSGTWVFQRLKNGGILFSNYIFIRERHVYSNHSVSHKECLNTWKQNCHQRGGPAT